MDNLEGQVKNIYHDTNRDNWDLVKFEEIAFNISERVEPGHTTAQIYVGLEHLDSNSLHIRRTGVPSDVKGTKLKVYKNDIIFGKRRAYQRKAAIADFDGICSAHAMVLRANPKKVDPDFFPFLLHSDAFMNKAVEISEGSLSPTIKWKSLKEQSFRLPPPSVQKKLAELLWAMDDFEECLLSAIQKLYVILQTEFEENFQDSDSEETTLKNIADINPLMSQEESTVKGYVDFLPMEAISEDGEITLGQKIDFVEKKNSLTNFRNGDIIFAKITPCMENGKGALIEGVVSVLALGSTEYHILRPFLVTDQHYLYFLTKLPFFRKLAERNMTGSAGQKRVPTDFLRSFRFRPPGVKQREHLGLLSLEIWKQKKQYENQLSRTKKLAGTIINSII